MCCACGDTVQIFMDCPQKDNKDTWLAKISERLNKNDAPAQIIKGLQDGVHTEHCCMTRLFYCNNISDKDNFYPV